MLFDHIISEICNSMIGEVILIGNNTTLLDYGHQFIRSLHIVDSRSWTPSFISLLFTQNIGVQFILFIRMLNQLHNQILRESVLLWVPMVPTLSSYTMITWFMIVGLTISSLLCKNGILVIVQVCTRDSEKVIWIRLID